MKTGKPLLADISSCTVPKGACAFWWLGQLGFVVKLAGKVVYLDAFVSPHAGRLVAPLLKPEEIANADFVFGSHDHADHIDRPAWPAIARASPKAIFIVPERLRRKVAKELGIALGRVVGIDKGISRRFGLLSFTGVPAAHELLERDKKSGLHNHIGLVLSAPGFTLYHSGDTCVYEGMQALLRRWKLEVVFLPINGRDAKRLASGCIGNMTYQEAADLAGAVRPGLTVPGHFEMFPRNSEDPELFAAYMAVKYPKLKTIIPAHGKRMLAGKKG